MRHIIERAVESAVSDFLEIRVEDVIRTDITFSGKILKKAQVIRSFGGYVRSLVNGSWGFIAFNDFGRLMEYVKLAEIKAKIAGQGKTVLYPVKPIVDIHKLSISEDDDPRLVSMEEKVEVLGSFAQALLSQSPKIVSSNVGYREEFKRIVIANTDGTFIEMEGLWVSGGLSAIGVEGNNIQSVYSGFGTRNSWKEILKAQESIDDVVRNTIELLHADPVDAGRYTVILDPRLAGVFIHEAFGHLSEADNVSDNPDLLKQMKLGTRFGQDHLNVLDGGAIPNERGSFPYDDEGIPSSTTYLIKNGKLAGRLHSRETAGAMRENVTGNARTVGFQFAPICRMSNTYIDKGPHKFEEMLESINDGLYVIGGGSGNTSKGLFTFSAEKARVIKNGKLGNWVRDLVFSGNVFQTLMDIDMVGDDLIRPKSGSCGKSIGARMQFPLNVSMGSPHIRIQNVLVGGK